MEFIKNNKKYLFIFIACLLIMVVAIIPQYNLAHIVGKYLFNPGHYFKNTDHFVPKDHHNIFEIISGIFRSTPAVFDYILVFSTVDFQFLLPFLPVLGCISFYSHYNRIMKFTLIKKRSFKRELYKTILRNALKLSIAVFLAYLCIYLIVISISWMPTNSNEPTAFLTDLLSNSFYFKHTYVYFLLEGFIRFFYMPFVYAMLVQAAVLVFASFRDVFLTSVVYFFGLSTIAYGIYYLSPIVAIHINPAVIMASGDYADINSIVMILINSIPLFIAIGIIEWRGKHVEV